MVYGIDLGTTYARIAKLNGIGEPEVLTNYETAAEELPVAVFVLGDETIVVGEAAKEEGFYEPERVFQHFKRWIGNDQVDNRKLFSIESREYSPIELCAFVLSRLVEYAKASGEDVKDVVITCPACFDPHQRDELKQAGILAGLNVLAVVNEPIAATMSYSYDWHNTENTVLVFDLGGATLDISLLHIQTNGDIEFLGYDRDDTIGGIEWDKRLFQLLLKKLEEDYSWMASETPDELQNEIYAIVESTKKKLSIKENAKAKRIYEGERIILEVAREEFENATVDLVNQTILCLESALSCARLNDTDVDTVLLVGGATKMPMIHNMITQRFGEKVINSSPDMAIAKGAALIAQTYLDKKFLPYYQERQDKQPKKKGVKERLEEQLRIGSARLVYDKDKDRIRVVYRDDVLDHPLISQMVDELRHCLNNLFENHIRIENIRRDMKGLFFDSERAKAMSVELNDLITSQKRIEELFASVDHWNSISKKKEPSRNRSASTVSSGGCVSPRSTSTVSSGGCVSPRNTRDRGYVYDAVENSPEYKAIQQELEEKIDAQTIDVPKGMGFCHAYWRIKKEILKNDYNIDWRSPAELNKSVSFD